VCYHYTTGQSKLDGGGFVRMAYPRRTRLLDRFDRKGRGGGLAPRPERRAAKCNAHRM